MYLYKKAFIGDAESSVLSQNSAQKANNSVFMITANPFMAKGADRIHVAQAVEFVEHRPPGPRRGQQAPVQSMVLGR